MKFILYIFNLLLCLSTWASIDINGIGISGSKTQKSRVYIRKI
nr:hypothetical protein [uncultured Campylobacter sp.]